MICGRGPLVCPIIGLSITALVCGVVLLGPSMVPLDHHSHSPCLWLPRWFSPLTTLTRRACPSACSSLTYSPCLSLALLVSRPARPLHSPTPGGGVRRGGRSANRTRDGCGGGWWCAYVWRGHSPTCRRGYSEACGCAHDLGYTMHEMRSEICDLRTDDDMILMTRACVMCHLSCVM